MPNHKKKNNQPNSNYYLTERIKKSRIPQENILDLKSIFIEKKEAREVKRPVESFLEKIDRLIAVKEKPDQPGGLKIKKQYEESSVFEQKEVSERLKFKMPKLNWRPLLVFVLVAFLLVTPIFGFVFYQKLMLTKGKVLGASVSAYNHLKDAVQATSEFKIEQASHEYDDAYNNFILAEEEINKINKVISGVIGVIPSGGNLLTSSNHLLQAGKNISEVGKLLSKSLSLLSENELQVEGSSGISTINLALLLDSIKSDFNTIESKIAETIDHLDQVRVKSLPKDYQNEIARVKEQLPQIKEYFSQFTLVSDVFLNILGQDTAKEYLFIFQNNHEIRPTGGFIGSLALVDINRGEVKILEVPGRGPYEINDDFREKIIAPKPMWIINPYWQIQDANWFFDFPASAKKIISFYEGARGFPIDGVITLNPSVVERILEVTGPIDMTDKYGVVITKDNFVEETLNKVELEYNKESNRPKQFIADLLPIIIKRMLSFQPKYLGRITGSLWESLSQKDILFYSTDSEIENKIQKLGWGGEIRNTDEDYLAVVDTNIGGGKTDGVIEVNINHQVEILSDGSITDTLNIKRIHHGEKGNIWTGIKNMDYVRIYVPSGSELVEATGFTNIDQSLIMYPDATAKEDNDLKTIEANPVIDERSNTRITQEFGKTVFANWIGTEAGETTEVTLKYKLPFKISNEQSKYSLMIQKQPGSFDPKIISEVLIPENLKVVWQSPADSSLVNYKNKVFFDNKLDIDRYFGIVLEKK